MGVGVVCLQDWGSWGVRGLMWVGVWRTPDGAASSDCALCRQHSAAKRGTPAREPVCPNTELACRPLKQLLPFPCLAAGRVADGPPRHGGGCGQGAPVHHIHGALIPPGGARKVGATLVPLEKTPCSPAALAPKRMSLKSASACLAARPMCSAASEATA